MSYADGYAPHVPEVAMQHRSTPDPIPNKFNSNSYPAFPGIATPGAFTPGAGAHLAYGLSLSPA